MNVHSDPLAGICRYSDVRAVAVIGRADGAVIKARGRDELVAEPVANLARDLFDGAVDAGTSAGTGNVRWVHVHAAGGDLMIAGSHTSSALVLVFTTAGGGNTGRVRLGAQRITEALA